MTYYEAKSFLDIAESYKADIRHNNSLWEYYDNDDDDEATDENKALLACEIVNWAERGDKIELVKRDGDIVPFADLGIEPALFEDEIAVIIEKFTKPGSKVKILSPYADGRQEKALKIIKTVDYFHGDKYSKAVIYAVYDAMENDYLISIDGQDIMELRKHIEY